MKGEHELAMVLGDRRYRVRGWKKPLNPRGAEGQSAGPSADRSGSAVPRGHARPLQRQGARRLHEQAAGIELGEAEDVIKHDLGAVLLKLEEMQDARAGERARAEDDRPAMSDGGTRPMRWRC